MSHAVPFELRMVASSKSKGVLDCRLAAACLQTIECGVAPPPFAVSEFFSRRIKDAGQAPKPGSSTWQPDKACSSCNGCGVQFHGLGKSALTRLRCDLAASAYF